MPGEDARIKAGLKTAEDELNLIKNQIQQTLLDIREHILDVTNPFNDPASSLKDADAVDVEESLLDSGSDGGGGGGDGGSDVDEEVIDGEGEEDADDLLTEEEMPVDEYEDLPGGDEVVTEDGGGGGGGGGLSDYLAPEEMLDDALPGEAFELDDVEGPPLEEPAYETATDEELDEEQTPLDEGEEQEMAQPSSRGGTKPNMAQLDLVTLASLVRWVSLTTQRLGRHRMDVLLDTYELAGRITPQVRAVIRSLGSIGDEDPDGDVPVRDIIAAMVRMEGVLNVGSSGADSNRLLGLLLGMEDDPLDRLLLG